MQIQPMLLGDGRPWQEADATFLDKRVLNLIDGVSTE